jgi:hypothetical protein
VNVRELIDGDGRRPSWSARLLGHGDGTRDHGSGATAMTVAALAMGAFVASLVMRWQTVTVDTSGDGGSGDLSPNALTFDLRPGSTDALTFIYILGGVLLLVAAGTAMNGAATASRLRAPTLGLTGAVVAILVSITIRLPDRILEDQFLSGGGFPREFQNRLTMTTDVGLYTAYAAAVLPLVAIVLASRSAGRARPVIESQVDQTAERVEPEPRADTRIAWTPTTRAEGATGLTVTAEPIDRTGGTDVWRR